MRIHRLHDWNVSIPKALEIQFDLARRVIRQGEIGYPHLICGLDVSVNNQSKARAVAVVLNYPELTMMETSVAKGEVEFPYVPGLLSFREVPLTLKAYEKLKHIPDLIFVDGQGIAHPRRIGLASHLGLFLDVPTIGCAKSRLVGSSEEPPETFGAYTCLRDKNGEIIGAALRTKPGVKPIYVSIGHKIDLPKAIYWVLQCCKGFRLPEPTRIAHLMSKGQA